MTTTSETTTWDAAPVWPELGGATIPPGCQQWISDHAPADVRAAVARLAYGYQDALELAEQRRVAAEAGSMTSTSDTATWDAAPVDPALWRAMEEIERLYERATPGPWLVDPDDVKQSYVYVNTSDEDGLLIASSWDGVLPPAQIRANMRSIAALHTHAPALIAAVRRLAGRNLDLEATVAQQGATLEAQAGEIERMEIVHAGLRTACDLALRAMTEGMADVPNNRRDSTCAELRVEAKRVLRGVLGEESEG